MMHSCKYNYNDFDEDCKMKRFDVSCNDYCCYG